MLIYMQLLNNPLTAANTFIYHMTVPAGVAILVGANPSAGAILTIPLILYI